MIETQTNIVTYAGDGTTTGFATPGPFIANSDLVVTLIDGLGTRMPQTIGADFSASGAATGAPGTVTMVVAPAFGFELEIKRVLPLTQLLDMVAFDMFPADAVEQELDKLTMIAQQLDQRLGALEAGGGVSPISALNIAGPGVGIFATQSAATLFFKKLVGGTNVVLTDNGIGVQIDVTAPGVSYPGTLNQVLRGDGTWTNVIGDDVNPIVGLEIHSGDWVSDFPTHLSFKNAVGGTNGKWWGFRTDGTESDKLSFTAFDDGGPYAGNVAFDVFYALRAGAVLQQLAFGVYNGNSETAYAFGYNATGLAASVGNQPGIYMTGNLTLGTDVHSATGPRITGDMSNATITQRLSVQTSTPNSPTSFQVIPNGTAQVAGFLVFNNSDINNASYLACFAFASAMTVQTSHTGTGVDKAFRFQAGLGTPISFNTTGNVLIGQTEASDDATNILQVNGHMTLRAAKVYKINNVQVVGARDTGWAAMTGTPNKASVYDTATVTLAQLAGRVAQLQAALTAHGLIGA